MKVDVIDMPRAMMASFFFFKRVDRSILRLGLTEKAKNLKNKNRTLNRGLFSFFLCSRVALEHSRVRNNESFKEKECEELIEKSRLA